MWRTFPGLEVAVGENGYVKFYPAIFQFKINLPELFKQTACTLEFYNISPLPFLGEKDRGTQGKN